MPFKNRLFFACLLILTATLIAIWFAPLVVSNGIRLWVWWKARQEGLVVNLDQIDAPLLRPVVIRGCRLRSGPDNAFQFEFTVKQASLELNFKHILLGTHGRAVRDFSIQELRGELRRSNPAGRKMTQGGWVTLHKLLPQNLSVASLDIRVEVGTTTILLRKGFLSASEIEAGRFSAAEVMIESPWLRQTFSDLRGATNWQNDRLAVAGLSLTHGLDLQSITADVSRLADQRVGVEFDVDAFGGKIRANISQDWRSQPANWKIAGSASGISLAQTSEAIGFTDRIDGLLHACNFTLSGNLAEPSHVIASLWTELTALTWRNRTAEAITLGAVLYNRQIQLQQLYIRQKTNQLTLSGEASFPNSSDWFSPDFRGEISASINQLGDFAALFGANPGDFAGKIAVDGTMNTRNRKLGGHLTLDGVSLTLFKTAIDTLSAKLNLKATELEIEQLDLKRKNDSLTAQGKIDMSHEHDYSGTISATIDDLAEYLSIFRGSAEKNSKRTPTHIQITIDSNKWNARGVIGLPNSSPVDFTANFPLPIGTDWTAFLASPLNVTLDFPSIFLANAPQFFHPEIFREGVLSGTLSLSETLQHPRITGEAQLVNGSLQNAPLDLTEANGCVTFSGNRASLDFINAAANDVDLSLLGEIDFHDRNDVVIKIAGATPIFDLTMRPIDCVGKIEIGAVAIALAPAVAEIEFRGALFQSGWTIGLKEQISAQSFAALAPNETARKFPLCSSSITAAEKTLFLGAPGRPKARRETIRPKKRRR
ncbi:MAG TPA: hypothetical protein VGQ70_04970 [Candidatus Udaeobacter sp.]|nr:hypothetical protein [Candidatus Udaeobacter sp.]